MLPIIDADVYDGQVVIVSEYANGGSLADKLKTEGKLSITKAVEMAVGILNGLDYLHRKKIIHRDIKPQNILLQDETPRLADFGISRAMNTSTISSAIVGTDAYMSPEAFQGKRTVQTDIWSVGVLLYVLLADNLPFPQEHPSERMYSILMNEPEPLSDDVPQKLKEIVRKALAKLPENRYQSAVEMREELQRVLVNINHPTFAPTEILRQPITPEFQTAEIPTIRTDEQTIRTNEPDIQTNQTEKLPEYQKPNVIKPTQPAIRINESVEPKSAVTQIKSQQADENQKPLPTVAQISADRPILSGKKNKALYYTGIGAVVLILLLSLSFLFISENPNKSQSITPTITPSSRNAAPPSNSYSSNVNALTNSLNTNTTTLSQAGNGNTISNTNSAATTGLVRFTDGSDKIGYKDVNGNVVIEPKYDESNGFNEGLAPVRLGKKWGYIDELGNVVIPFTFNHAYRFTEGLASVLGPNDNYGFIDKTGKVIVPFKYYDSGEFENGYVEMQLYGGKKVRVDRNGKESPLSRKKD